MDRRRGHWLCFLWRSFRRGRWSVQLQETYKHSDEFEKEVDEHLWWINSKNKENEWDKSNKNNSNTVKTTRIAKEKKSQQIVVERTKKEKIHKPWSHKLFRNSWWGVKWSLSLWSIRHACSHLHRDLYWDLFSHSWGELRIDLINIQVHYLREARIKY